jgi:tRNA pseudouridine13 synthase
MRVLETHRHGNKLRLGHLRANTFTIKVRQTEPDRLAELQDGLAELGRRGVPNYFGSQRFGYRGDTWQVGRAIVKGNLEEAVDLILGRPGPADYGDIRKAREAYERGEYEQAARAWPQFFHSERRALKAIAQARGKRRRGFAAIDRNARTFYVSAYQSYLFNQVMVARLPEGLEHLWPGDLAWLHASGAVFRVEDLAREQARADAFDISPTGPLFGYRMTEPTDRPGELEASVLAAEGLSPQAFHQNPLRVKGARRPLRFQPRDAHLALGADERGPYLELRFVLPRGCYATALLRELFRPQTPDGADAESEELEDPAS